MSLLGIALLFACKRDVVDSYVDPYDDLTPTLTLSVDGLDGPVDIVRDRSGIPHVRATTLRDAGVELRGDERTRAAIDFEINAATDADWDAEYLDLILAVRVVDNLDAALDHIDLHSTGHSEAIVTDSLEASRAFTDGVDSACVYINASTRFTDGGEYGMGAEVGNSTARLHVRGPIGLEALTTSKYVVIGTGQTRG